MEQRLFPRIHAALRARNYSPRTDETYVQWIRRFIFFHGKKHPSSMGADEVNAFLTHLAVDANVSATTQNQALSAILFLYRVVLNDPLPWLNDVVRARRSMHVPVVLSAAEVHSVLKELAGAPRLVTQLLYGGGLRLLEALRLRVKDLDFARSEILVRETKGKRDRVTTLPRTIVPQLQKHLERVKGVHEKDVRLGFGSVALPGALDRKLPGAQREWVWQWVFPRRGVTSTSRRAPSAGIIFTRARFNARCTRRDCEPGSPRGSPVTVSVTPSRRISWKRGQDIRTVQELLGHRDVTTTMIYTHVLRLGAKGVRSPLDTE